MLKISLKEGQYVNIGDDIRVVYVGRSGSNGKLMMQVLRENLQITATELLHLLWTHLM